MEASQQQLQVSGVSGITVWLPSCCSEETLQTAARAPDALPLTLGNHDVRGRCGGQAVVRDLLAGLGPAPLRLAATDLPDAPK
mmetsp:Transcript_76144/g.150586  ORF Transcript_76144/g.150586 Transcript_76144/m.150586 type:complete len:83 (-) Transcript_76144:297-545(-)